MASASRRALHSPFRPVESLARTQRLVGRCGGEGAHSGGEGVGGRGRALLRYTRGGPSAVPVMHRLRTCVVSRRALPCSVRPSPWRGPRGQLGGVPREVGGEAIVLSNLARKECRSGGGGCVPAGKPVRFWTVSRRPWRGSAEVVKAVRPKPWRGSGVRGGGRLVAHHSVRGITRILAWRVPVHRGARPFSFPSGRVLGEDTAVG